MKILLFNGSPRRNRSASMRVARKFVEGITRSVEAEVEEIVISDCNIKPCMGCLSCWGRTEGTCVIQDDIPAIKQKILDADVIILSCPLYFFGLPGHVKEMVDRLLSMMKTYRGQEAVPGEPFHGLRYDLSEKKIFFISSCGYGKLDYIYDPVLMQLDCVLGKGNYTALLCPQGNCLIFPDLYEKMEKYLEKYIAAGQEFGETGTLTEETLTKLAKPPFSDRTFKILLNHYWDMEHEIMLEKAEQQGE